MGGLLKAVLTGIVVGTVVQASYELGMYGIKLVNNAKKETK